ncbi:g10208 [Coccomyxa viridis]|uniref:COP9 signalosome complex subunit 8 n=1 Tax=Coccomyxa viridis TaxID=1274662 RepID=A0ABP1G568_9CHLO
MSAFDQHALSTLLEQQRYEEVAPQLDEEEVKSATQDTLSGNWPVVIHLLGHLYNGRLSDARFLWKRIPDQRKSQDEELAVALRLLQMMWNKEYQGVWQVLALPSWAPQSQPLVKALTSRIRSHNLQLVTRSYTTISAPKLAMMLGIPQAEVAQVAHKEGWTMDPNTGLCQVKPPQVPDQERANLKHLENLTEYLMHLERA